MDSGTVELILRALTFGSGLFIIFGVFLLFANLRKSEELIKARLFLHFKRLNNFFSVSGAIFVAAVVFHIFYVMFSLPPEWFNLDWSKGNFVPFGVYLLAVYWMIFYFCITVYLILRDVK